MIKVSLTIAFTDEDVRDIGDYLVLNYPPHKEARQHSLNWLRKEVIQAELNEVVMRRLAILRKNAANFKERKNERQTEGVPGD
jgi:uncharacterized membrane-anchored protein